MRPVVPIIAPVRLLFKGPTLVSDAQWLVKQSQITSEAFVAVVQDDLSCKFLRFDPEISEVVETSRVEVYSRAPFAHLPNGFWFVMDRLKQVQLDPGVSEAIVEVSKDCKRKASALIDKAPLSEQAKARQESVRCQDLDRALQILEQQVSRPLERLGVENLQSLLSTASSLPFLASVMQAFPGWKSDEASEEAISWMRACFRIRAFRSHSRLEELRRYVLEALPSLVDSVKAAEFMDDLREQHECEDDVATFLEEAGFLQLETHQHCSPFAVCWKFGRIAFIRCLVAVAPLPAFYINIYCVGFTPVSCWLPLCEFFLCLMPSRCSRNS